MKMKQEQLTLIQKQLKRLMSADGFYQHKYNGIDIGAIQSQEDFEKLPFTWKGDLREAYPLGLQAVPD
jgi:phenylacetate-CoA ligase